MQSPRARPATTGFARYSTPRPGGSTACWTSRLAEVGYFVATEGGLSSIADFAILGWAWRHERHKVSLDDFPNVKRWYEALMARPGVQRGFDVKLS